MTRVFSMFVLEALILTFMTTPLVVRFYPPHVRRRVSAVGATFGSVADDATRKIDRKNHPFDAILKRRFTVVLDKLEHLPGAMAISQLVKPSAALATRCHRRSLETPTSRSPHNPRALSIEALRLIELSERTSAVMKSSVADSLLRTDPLLAVFKMFGQLNALPITPSIAIVPYDDLSYSVSEYAGNHESDMVMLPWLPPFVTPPATASPSAATQDGQPSSSQPVTPKATTMTNPFDLLFKTSTVSATDKPSSSIHSQFVRGVFAQARTDVALFVDQSTDAGVNLDSDRSGNQHLFLPFFGGPDDRLALDFVVQVCANEEVSATVVRMFKGEVKVPLSAVPSVHVSSAPKSAEEANVLTVASVMTGLPDTVYGQFSTATRLQSETADNISWARYASPTENQIPALSRIEFKEITTPIPLHAGIREAEDCRRPGVRFIIVAGRGRRLAVENHARELKDVMGEYGSVGSEVKKTIGDVATAFVVAGCAEGVVVMQEAYLGKE
ncbi:hypothetical protein C0992_003831 [Termitomyces sp. T32_za158]|nr:hypothetical protein C0992_003831 [Termitomyces sp. T32_za158]